MHIKKLLNLTYKHDRNIYLWLIDAISKWEQGEDLSATLGLRGALAIKKRNELICDLAYLLSPEKSQTTWQRAKIVEKNIKYFESRIIPKINKNPDIKLSQTDSIIKEIWSIKVSKVTSQRRIYDLLR